MQMESRLPPTASTSGRLTEPRLQSQHGREAVLLIEYRNLKYHAPPGVYVMPSFESLQAWEGAVFVRQGLYKGGIFKFTIRIPDGYPKEWPSVRFTTPLLHPQVDSQGFLNLTLLLQGQTLVQGYIVSLLKYIHDVFHSIVTESPANPYAAVMYKDARRQFAQQAEDCASKSSSAALQTRPGASLRFQEFNLEHQEALEDILQRQI
ncbi:ubiquitin-conjugating enzyme [Klebsormidium nitens]|uniref:Ubiquitin-conjugating enzyme n=1 Tax=Klebsormidium nitens TaxID=105231 RepID=A0A1Y1HQF2_KLENI|nr:ubiquitin-conjugating enzyme [Klebsormidium nitens]|eukprot:GAQ79211.1 ubiquitin-conjugating enzyme [Klebsormidium nitens]